MGKRGSARKIEWQEKRMHLLKCDRDQKRVCTSVNEAQINRVAQKIEAGNGGLQCTLLGCGYYCVPLTVKVEKIFLQKLNYLSL